MKDGSIRQAYEDLTIHSGKRDGLEHRRRHTYREGWEKPDGREVMRVMRWTVYAPQGSVQRYVGDVKKRSR